MVGFCHLTDSHHYHHGQKPTMVGICHGGNMLGNHLHHLDFSMLPKLKISFFILEAYILLSAKYPVQRPKTKWKYGWGSCAQKGDQMKEVHY